MKEQLIQYVNLLFAGVPQAADIKEEILQNTLDRYDDLIAQGKSPQAAYSLAISGIGDINEILIAQADATPVEPQPVSQAKPGAAVMTPGDWPMMAAPFRGVSPVITSKPKTSVLVCSTNYLGKAQFLTNTI